MYGKTQLIWGEIISGVLNKMKKMYLVFRLIFVLFIISKEYILSLKTLAYDFHSAKFYVFNV